LPSNVSRTGTDWASAAVAAVHVLDGFPKLVNVIGHADHHSHHGERRRARWSIR